MKGIKGYRNLIEIVLLFGAVIVFTSFIGKSHEKTRIDFDAIINNLSSPHKVFVSDYNNFILNQIDSSKTVGAALAIVSHDSVIFMDTYGVKIAGTSDSVDIHTKFRLASVSKGFAGVLSCILQEEGVINLDEKITEILPGFSLKSSDNTQKLTIKNTLNHTTGIESHAFDGMASQGVPYSEIIGQLKNADIAGKTGEVYSYQNAIFSLIDTIIRVKTNCTYIEMLNDKIFTPLGMTDATVDFSSMQSGTDIAYPHKLVNGNFKPFKLNSGYYNVAPAAGVNASISDMSKWLKALMGANPKVIDSVVLSEISTPLIYTPLQRHYTQSWGKVDDKHYSLGWRIYNYMGHTIIYHGGFVNGYRAEIAFCPELKTGIVFLENSPNQLAGKVVPEFWKKYFTFLANAKSETSDLYANSEN
jgi:beta-lactamase class C